MEKKLFKIGDMSKLFNLSVSSIRHYEDLGLLVPAKIDPDTGYRYYSTNQFEAFNAIRYLRALDMPLSEITDFLKNRDVEKIEEKLKSQRSIVEEKIAELRRIERKIDNRLRQIEDAKNSALDIPEIVTIPRCRLYYVEESLTIREFHDPELPITNLGKSQAEAVIFLGKVGFGISEENLRAKRFSSYDGIFLMLDDEDRFDGEVTELPETLSARIRFCGCHTEAGERYEKLLAFIEANGYAPSGFSREITLIDYGITNDTDKFVTEIVVPIMKIDN